VGFAILAGPDQHLERQVDSHPLVNLHRLGARLGIAEDQHSGGTQR